MAWVLTAYAVTAVVLVGYALQMRAARSALTRAQRPRS